MKKVCITFILLFAVLFNMSAVVQADSGIVENPGIKMVVDGKLEAFTDVPIVSEGRTLLPLRAVLVKLGIPDNGSNIVWDAAERSITICKGAKKVYLKVDSNTALVNEAPVTLDVPPVIYRSRAYIPVRFVAQSLDKKVVWDDPTRTVLITDEKQFDSVKTTLDKAVDATEALTKFKVEMQVRQKITGQEGVEGGTINCAFDKTKKNAFMSVKDAREGSSGEAHDRYIIDEDSFAKYGTGDTGWEEDYGEGFEATAAIFGKQTVLNFDETVYAGVVTGTSENPDEIVFKGDSFVLRWVLSAMGDTELEPFKDSTNYSEIVIDRNTGTIKRIVSNMNCVGKQKGDFVEVTFNFTEPNGNFEIEIPEGIQSQLDETQQP